jgi:hypothetical protein
MNADKHGCFVRIQETTSLVIPAKAGIQTKKHCWTPAFAGVTALRTSYETVATHTFIKQEHLLIRVFLCSSVSY